MQTQIPSSQLNQNPKDQTPFQTSRKKPKSQKLCHQTQNKSENPNFIESSNRWRFTRAARTIYYITAPKKYIASYIQSVQLTSLKLKKH